MPESLAREIGLLRKLVAHLEWRPLPFERLTQDLLRREGLGHVREKTGGIIAIRVPAHYALSELTDCLLERFPAMERGAIYSHIQTELFNFVEDYVDREPSSVGSKDTEPSSVGSKDAKALVAHFQK